MIEERHPLSIFIVGSGRSGTTPLRDVIGVAPELLTTFFEPQVSLLLMLFGVATTVDDLTTRIEASIPAAYLALSAAGMILLFQTLLLHNGVPCDRVEGTAQLDTGEFVHSRKASPEFTGSEIWRRAAERRAAVANHE
jgi:hypothetical protein